MIELKGKPVADSICEKLREKVEQLKQNGKNPTLATVRVGTKPDDIYYEQGATKRMASVGIAVRNVVLDKDVTEEEVISTIQKLNEDNDVSGILLFMPLPKTMNGNRVKNFISPEKDVDGLTDISVARLYNAEKNCFAPCTPSAVVELLKFYNIDIEGKNVVVIGRSAVVGKPLSLLMLKENATVTICHTKTQNIREICKRADILVASAGRAKMVTTDYVSEGAVVVDVGINQDENGNMCGDVDYENVKNVASALSPVPGGVGSITTSILAMHTVQNL